MVTLSQRSGGLASACLARLNGFQPILSDVNTSYRMLTDLNDMLMDLNAS
jgi:hypothetical protein